MFDGQSVRELDRTSLRRHLAMVFQDGGLLSGGVRENIALGAPDASFEQIQNAAKIAKAHEFIMALPKTYDYEVGHQGMTLSSGQRQRIAIARALLRNAAILILDEATSNLDSETERAILDAILKMRRCRTTIIITHRLTTALHADRVVILNRGSISETGGHQELIEKRGKYHSMWKAVLPNFEDGSDLMNWVNPGS